MTKDIVDRMAEVELPPVPEDREWTATERDRIKKWGWDGDSDTHKRMQHFALADAYRFKVIVRARWPESDGGKDANGYLHRDPDKGMIIGDVIRPDAQEFHAADLMDAFHELNLSLWPKPLKNLDGSVNRRKVRNYGEYRDMGIRTLAVAGLALDKVIDGITVWFSSGLATIDEKKDMAGSRKQFNIWYGMQMQDLTEDNRRYIKMILEWTTGLNG